MDLLTGQIVATAIAAVVGTIVSIYTFTWRKKQKRGWLLNEQLQTDSHTLRLCEALSNPSPQLRLAAAALLLERLKQFAPRSSTSGDQSAIIQALIAATIRGTDKPDATSSVLSKYIADEVVRVLKATSASRATSPLTPYYWQRVHMTGAFWKGVDARGADFFAANFDKASLRRANLQGAIFYEASLVGAILAGADLRNADLRNADLRGANLSDDERKDEGVQKTQWSGIRLAGASYDASTKLPAGLDPVQQGMVRLEDCSGLVPA